jgi:flavin reductase (DIM6/NTAB) family NADH-FMN oxidoreductase RutF
MAEEPADNRAHRLIDTSNVSGRDRYQLLISLVVPRPIAWVSTSSPAGQPNLAPFSYFAALSATPMLVGISIGSRGSGLKDSLRNIRDTRAFCVNLVTERHLVPMNESAAEYPPQVDEFERAGLVWSQAERVPAPFVADCPAVLECRLVQEVSLEESTNTLVIGRVELVRLDPRLEFAPGTRFVETDSLRPVARLWGDRYAFLGEILELARPRVEDG